MAVKALIFDIDGTILNSKGTMTEPTLRALRRCREGGCILSVATARAGRIVFRKEDIPWEHDFLLDRGIFYHGAVILDKPHHFYQHVPIPAEVVGRIVEFVERGNNALQIAVQCDSQYHAFRHEMEESELARWGFSPEECIALDLARKQYATKIMIYSGRNLQSASEDLGDLFSALQSAFTGQARFLLADSRTCIYILSRHVDKGSAVRKLLSLYDISPEETAVFGDDTPDLEMFGQFGHSIAMGNAHEELKRNATFVTLTNDEDGVIHALREYLKIL